jgi:hypothetical protein
LQALHRFAAFVVLRFSARLRHLHDRRRRRASLRFVAGTSGCAVITRMRRRRVLRWRPQMALMRGQSIDLVAVDRDR